jgi:hypothetical protein
MTRIAPQFLGYVSAALRGVAISSGGAACEGGERPCYPPEVEEPTFDVAVDCYDALLTAEAVEEITLVRYRITTVDDPGFAAAILDTGWIAPEYLGSGPTWITFWLQEGMQAGSYLAIIEAEVGGIPYASAAIPFTILGLSVEFWGGWDNRVVSA